MPDVEAADVILDAEQTTDLAVGEESPADSVRTLPNAHSARSTTGGTSGTAPRLSAGPGLSSPRPAGKAVGSPGVSPTSTMENAAFPRSLGDPRPAWSLRLCSLPVCFIAAVVCLLAVGVQTLLYKRFTPVYTKTECGNQTATMDNWSMGMRWVRIGIEIQVTCTNPNPYGISIISSDPGATYADFQSWKYELGKLRVVAGSHLPADGSGLIRVRMDTTIRGDEADEMLLHLFSDKAIPILMELRFRVGVSISFGLLSWSVTAPFSKACGLNMAGVLVNQFLPVDSDARSNRLGPLICRTSFDGLREQLPPVGEREETPRDGNMGFSAAQVAPEEVQAGEFLKTISLGVCITNSILMFMLCMLFTLGGVGHPEGVPGVWWVVRGRCLCDLSLHFLVLLAWNGFLTIAKRTVPAASRPRLEGLMVPLEKLQRKPSEALFSGLCRSTSSWMSPLVAKLGPWQEMVAITPFSDRWRRLFSKDAAASTEMSGRTSSSMRGALSKQGKGQPGGAYHRLGGQLDCPYSSSSGHENDDELGLGKAAERPARSTAAPLLAVSARRAERLLEASAWESDSQFLPTNSSKFARGSAAERRHGMSSSRAYAPDEDMPRHTTSAPAMPGEEHVKAVRSLSSAEYVHSEARSKSQGC